MRKIAIGVLLAALAGGTRAADEPAKAPSRLATLRTWFQHLKEGLADSSVSAQYQQKRSVTAVAAVRGAGQESVDPNKPQWKGGARSKRAAEMKKEKAEFGEAVDLIIAGKTADGVARLDAFEKAHPKSPLLKDVRDARVKAKELDAPAEDEQAAKEKAERPKPAPAKP